MLFHSTDFFVLFPIIVLLFYIVPHKFRSVWLLLASYYFYMSWNPKYAVLLMISTLVAYGVAIVIQKVKGNLVLKRGFLFVGIFFQLAQLCFFKYFNFGLTTLERIFGIFHIKMELPVFDLMLPVGISFYSFLIIGYLVDVYKEKTKAETSILQFALFVSFFPNFAAGPIERANHLLPQIAKTREFSYELVKKGLLLMAFGYFQKLVIAHRAGIVVDQVYGNLDTFHGVQVLIAVFCFAIQIYCDFSGYTMIAIGAANVLGFQLQPNFRQPYLARSIQDFWRRWHISLSGWFRDYLYIPLGGNRGKKWKTYRNLMITFLISGLWHGASWHFVIWGGLNGVYEIAGDITRKSRSKVRTMLQLKENSFVHQMIQRVMTFFLVSVTWIFFRAEGFRVALSVIKKMCSEFHPSVLWDGSIYELGLDRYNMVVLLIAIVLLVMVDVLHESEKSISSFLGKQPLFLRWLCYLSISLILIFQIIYQFGGPASDFIYSKF